MDLRKIIINVVVMLRSAVLATVTIPAIPATGRLWDPSASQMLGLYALCPLQRGRTWRHSRWNPMLGPQERVNGSFLND